MGNLASVSVFLIAECFVIIQMFVPSSPMKLNTVIHLQFWAYGSWDSLFLISMSPSWKLMSPEHYLNDKSAILIASWDSLK